MLSHSRPLVDADADADECVPSVVRQVIWCLESHCPTSALDWQADATKASCLSDVHNLAGYVTRKRPTANYALARKYYDEALRYTPTHCPTLQYLTELNLQTSNVTGAVATAESLCTTCGSGSHYAELARAAFQAAGATPPAACSTGLSTGALAGAIAGGVVLAIVGAYLIRKFACAPKTVPPPKGKLSAVPKPSKFDVPATPATPSVPPSPPGSDARGAGQHPPYVV